MNDETRSLFEPSMNTALIARGTEKDNILKTVMLVMIVREILILIIGVYWYLCVCYS